MLDFFLANVNSNYTNGFIFVIFKYHRLESFRRCTNDSLKLSGMPRLVLWTMDFKSKRFENIKIIENYSLIFWSINCNCKPKKLQLVGWKCNIIGENYSKFKWFFFSCFISPSLTTFETSVLKLCSVWLFQKILFLNHFFSSSKHNFSPVSYDI